MNKFKADVPAELLSRESQLNRFKDNLSKAVFLAERDGNTAETILVSPQVMDAGVIHQLINLNPKIMENTGRLNLWGVAIDVDYNISAGEVWVKSSGDFSS